jgi:hypothetical protein
MGDSWAVEPGPSAAASAAAAAEPNVIQYGNQQLQT